MRYFSPFAYPPAARRRAARRLPLAALLLATACTTAPDQPAAASNALVQNDFEQSLGWGGPQPSLSTTKAHSGRVAVVASPEVPFGYTFARTLAELGLPAGAQHLELSGWVLRTAAGSTARLVVQLDASATDDTHVYYTSLPLAEAQPAFGEWRQVRLPVELPTTALGPNRLKIYLWNDKGTSPSYLDDVVLTRAAAKP